MRNQLHKSVPCPACHGKGWFDGGLQCGLCAGTGRRVRKISRHDSPQGLPRIVKLLVAAVS